MIEIPATEFVKNFGRYRDLAQREPLAITSHGRKSGYFLSEYEYQEYQQLKSQSRQVYHVSKLPEDTMIALLASKVDPAHEHLNALLDG